jgi:hypothetical protein
MKIHLLILISLFTKVFSQNLTVNKLFHPPLGIPMQLVSGFGDLRSNHFHMGIDLQTNGVEGIPIHAVLEGFVSRIKLSPKGYGKVLYLHHPNGMTSVYAHCSVFAKEILAIFLPMQEKLMMNDLDITLNPEDIPIHKGQLIAFSGNSGTSSGPHLHFELRDSKSEDVLNPFLNGFSLVDNFTPIIKAIKIYAVDKKGYQIPGKTLKINVSKTELIAGKLNKQIEIPANFVPSYGYLSLSISTADPVNNAGKTIAAFQNNCLLNGDTIFTSKIDRIAFDETRFINSHKDFVEDQATNTKFQKLFKIEHNPLEIYKENKLGLITINGNDSLNLEIIVTDVNANKVNLKFTVKNNFSKAPKSKIFYDSKTFFLPDSSYTLKTKNARIEIEKNTFYEPVNKLFIASPLQIGLANIPIQKPLKIFLKAKDNFPIQKQYIKVNKDALKTKILENELFAEALNLGLISIQIDTTLPQIKTNNFKEVDSTITKKVMSWKISDSQTAISSYNLFVDGKWTPLEYDLKNQILVFNRKNITLGKSTIRIILSDACGNEKVWEKILTFL